MDEKLTDKLRDKAFGHIEIWECTLEEFIEKVAPVLKSHQQKNNLSSNIIKTAAQFLRLNFDEKSLKGTIEYEVSKAIECSLMYYANVLGEEI